MKDGWKVDSISRVLADGEVKSRGVREDVPRGFTTKSVQKTAARKKGEVMVRKAQGDFPADL